LPLSEKVRVEIFIPDNRNFADKRLVEQLGNEMSYSFGGCTIATANGKYRATSGTIVRDRLNILYTDTPLIWDEDLLLISQYVERLKVAVHLALTNE
jgi:hypothetical protein